MRNATSQKVSVFVTITLPVTMGDYRLKVSFVNVHNLPTPLLLVTSFIDRFEKGISSPERKIVCYDSKLEHNFSIKKMPKEPRDMRKA